MSTLEDPHAEPTNEYNLRHAANGLVDLVNQCKNLSPDELATIDFAYKQLLRGANTIHELEARQ